MSKCLHLLRLSPRCMSDNRVHGSRCSFYVNLVFKIVKGNTKIAGTQSVRTERTISLRLKVFLIYLFF